MLRYLLKGLSIRTCIADRKGGVSYPNPKAQKVQKVGNLGQPVLLAVIVNPSFFSD